jgi:hypothetical protein
MRITQVGEYRGLSLRIEREIVGIFGRTDWRPTAHQPATQAPAS